MILLLLLTMGSAPAATSQVAADERLVFFPTHATYDAKSSIWRVHLHGWLFELERSSLKRRALKAAVRKGIGVPDDAAARKIYDDRISPFLVDNERGKAVTIRLAGRSISLGETSAGGHIAAVVDVSAKEMAELQNQHKTANGWIPFKALLPIRDTRKFSGRFLVIPDEGLSVISDVDDTIKITNVTDRNAMLANTFYRPFRPVEGMPLLYRDLQERGAMMHYVSASPWQLSEPLLALLKEHRFPEGTLYLQAFRLQSVRSLAELLNSKSKQTAIETLLKDCPQRRFVLFGDSGEHDPEIYGTLARRYPKQVVGIFIRNVTQDSPTGKRFREAFNKIDAAKWMLFDKPDEIRPRLRQRKLLQ